jgi:hypothetical protein
LNNRRKPPAKAGRTHARQPLATLSGILAEMARVYRRAKAKQLAHEEARSLVWMLTQMRAAAEALEVERLHGRLDEIDATLHVRPHNELIGRAVPPTLIESSRA